MTRHRSGFTRQTTQAAWRSVSWFAAVVGCVLALAFVSVGAASDSAASRSHRSHPRASSTADLYDLQRDESLGGHTLARHVGRTDEELAERLRREPQISAASTYTDVTTARRTVARALDVFRDRVSAWESRQGTRPNLVLHYTERDGTPVGRSLSRGERVSRPCDRALVVLRWLEREHEWIVLTSYPELAR